MSLTRPLVLDDRITTLASGGFSVETQISDNKGWDRASFVSYLDPIQPSALPTSHLTIYQNEVQAIGWADKQARPTARPSSLGGQGSYSGCLHWQGEVRPSDRGCRHKSQSGEVALAATPNTLQGSSFSTETFLKFEKGFGLPFHFLSYSFP